MSESPADADPAAVAWSRQLAEAPDAALQALLNGRAWLGGYASLEPPDALPQFLPEDLTPNLDGALQRWLNASIGIPTLPQGTGARQHARALTNAFGLLQSLDVPLSHRWCRENALRLWGWLANQPVTDAFNPRLVLLRALALRQPDRELLGFWSALCRQGQRGDQRQWVQLALFGLRRMPTDDEGTLPEGLPTAMMSGLIDYGVALSRSGDGNKKAWLGELDFLSAVYPMSASRWQARLRDALSHRSQPSVAQLRRWLDERFPSLGDSSAPAVNTKVLAPPPLWDNEIRPQLQRFDGQRAQVLAQLRALMQRHLHYAQTSGDPYFLVRSNCRLADFLLKPAQDTSQPPRDAPWALELGQQAAHWAPGNPQTWAMVARALDSLGDWARACTTFWYARRRFPYNPFAHTQLGHALAMRGFVDEGEAVYRAAIQRFPDNAVCWADLGNTLRVAGHTEEALAAYQQAKTRFAKNPSICAALASVLIDLGRAAEAESALQWAEQVCPADDARTRRVLVDQRQRLQALAQGQAVSPMRLRHRPETQAGDWSALENAAGISIRGIDALGQASLWRQSARSDGLDRAAQALEGVASVLGEDARWIAERGLWLAQQEGWSAAANHFEAAVARRPGDGVLAALLLTARQASGQSADWASLRGRFEDLAPLLRVAQDASARRPADLDAAVAAVTRDGNVDLDQLEDDTRQALWIYDSASDPEKFALVREDFLAARQLTVL